MFVEELAFFASAKSRANSVRELESEVELLWIFWIFLPLCFNFQAESFSSTCVAEEEKMFFWGAIVLMCHHHQSSTYHASTGDGLSASDETHHAWE